MFQNNKKVIYVILLGIILNFFTASTFVNNFDKNILKNDRQQHKMLKSDIAEYNIGAQKIINNYKNGKFLFEEEYYRSFLPQIIIAIYFELINEDIILNKDDQILAEATSTFKINNGKLGYFLFQILLYFSCLVLLFKNLQKNFSKQYLFILFFLFSLEPSVNQYHSSFLTESIYFSFLLLMIYFILKKEKSLLDFCLIGGLLGLMYAQRSISIGLFIPIIIYFFYVIKQNFFIKIFSLLIAMSIIISLIGYSNYKRMGVFYLTSYQAQTGFYHYIVAPLISKSENIKIEEANSKKKKITNNWIQEKNLNLLNEKDRLKLYKLQKNYSLTLILNNFYDFFKLHIWKTFQTMIIDPFQVFYQYFFDKSKLNEDGKRFWEYDLTYKKLYLITILYSCLFYLISFIGFIRVVLNFKNKRIDKEKFAFYLLCIAIILYFLAVSGWVGNPRYFSPCMIFLFFFTSKGILECKNFFLRYYEKL